MAQEGAAMKEAGLLLLAAVLTLKCWFNCAMFLYCDSPSHLLEDVTLNNNEKIQKIPTPSQLLSSPRTTHCLPSVAKSPSDEMGCCSPTSSSCRTTHFM